MKEGTTLGKVVDEIKRDLNARKENWKETFRDLKTRLSLKEVGKPIIIGRDTIVGKHGEKAREITARTLGRR